MTIGTVESLWRYPVKSMQGEEIDSTEVTERGFVGDRAYALLDAETGKIASAKSPRVWGRLFEFEATLVDSASPPRVRIRFPGGSERETGEDGLESRLSEVFERKVRVLSEAPENARYASVPLGVRGLEADEATDEMPMNRFFDAGAVHLITTASLRQLEELYPEGRFEPRRFRPNVVVRTPDGERGFVEDGWPGKTLTIGDEVRIRVMSPTIRCVMTTLPQEGLERDPLILRAAAQHNQGNVGVYALVVQGGTVRRGDELRVAE